MTEAEWLASEDPAAMLAWLGDKISDRKLRLFAAACCRAYRWTESSPAAMTEVLAVAESLADGEDAIILAARWNKLPQLTLAEQWLVLPEGAEHWATLMREADQGAAAAHALRDIVGNPYKPVTLPRDEGPVPFRTPSGGGLQWPGPCPWRTPQVIDLAAATYEHRIDGALDPFRLALLADALEEAGCDNGTILDHLRGQWQMPDPHLDGVWLTMADNKPHWRGCWAVDLILGKE